MSNRASRFEVVLSDAPQPWHARRVAKNGKKRWASETYVNWRSADRAIVREAEDFGWTEVSIVRFDDRLFLVGTFPGHARTRISEVRMVDERAKP